MGGASRRKSGHQHFWAFFPTETASLVSGIFNAPWKTNEDRHNLLAGAYNEELIDASARLVAESLPCLRTDDDPAAHIDALGGRIQYSLNKYASRLANAIYAELQDREIIPDMDGTLQLLSDIWIPPDFGSYRSEPLATVRGLWAGYAHRPSDWLHQSANTRERLAAIHRIHQGTGYQARMTLHASVPEWLEALTEAGVAAGDPVWASSTAIRIAASLPEAVRNYSGVGEIVLTAAPGWVEPAPDRIYLGDEFDTKPAARVHPDLQADPVTSNALVSLGIGQVSIESLIRTLMSELLALDPEESEKHGRWSKFWKLAHQVPPETITDNLSFESGGNVRVRTLAETWEVVSDVLLPGPIVPADGSRDAQFAVDIDIPCTEH